ncbi:hypothetical protein M8745_05895 [Lutimaribacter sp. EGI FJ00014]|nr:hypothetical protein [Lutimaribacter sp. EGI FJ00014]
MKTIRAEMSVNSSRCTGQKAPPDAFIILGGMKTRYADLAGPLDLTRTMPGMVTTMLETAR